MLLLLNSRSYCCPVVFLEFERKINEEIKPKELTAKQAIKEVKTAKKTYEETNGINEKYVRFHEYWSGLSSVSRIRLTRLTWARKDSWVFNFLGASWEQLKKISALPKITKGAIDSILGKITKPKQINKIKYDHSLEQAWDIIERNKEKLNLTDEAIEKYKERGINNTCELIEALKKDERPIADFIDKRSKPPTTLQQLSSDQIEKLVSAKAEARINSANEKASKTIQELEKQLTNYQEIIKQKDEEIAELKTSFETWKKEWREEQEISPEALELLQSPNLIQQLKQLLSTPGAIERFNNLPTNSQENNGATVTPRIQEQQHSDSLPQQSPALASEPQPETQSETQSDRLTSSIVEQGFELGSPSPIQIPADEKTTADTAPRSGAEKELAGAA